MDKILEQLGNEAGPFKTDKGLKEQRVQAQKKPKPEKKNRFNEWRGQKEKELRQQMQTIAWGMVQKASQDIASLYSDSGLLEHTMKNFEREQVKVMWPAVQLQYLDLLQEALENVCYSKELEVYNAELREFDNMISNIQSKFPKPFDISLINVDKRFPIDRIGFDGSNNRPFDKWLTEGLKSRKPIFFEPHDEYVKSLIRFYEEVYWTIAQKELEEKNRQAQEPAPMERVIHGQEPGLPLEEMIAFNLLPEMRDDPDEPHSKIYNPRKH